MAFIWAFAAIAVLGLLTAVSALIMATLANRRARATERDSAHRHTGLRTDVTRLEGRVDVLRDVANGAADKANLAFEATREMRKGRRLTDQVAPPKPEPA